MTDAELDAIRHRLAATSEGSGAMLTRQYRKDIIALLDRIEVLEVEARRPRWHHDWNQPPEAPHFCEECRLMHERIEALEGVLDALAPITHGPVLQRGGWCLCATHEPLAERRAALEQP